MIAYTDYVTSFVQTVFPDILCFDHYPVFGIDPADDTSTAGYHRNLIIIRNASLYAGPTAIPFWNFFGAMPFNSRVDFTESQLRWQVFTSLAYGSTGLLYFCYWPPSGPSFIWGNAVMTFRALPGEPSPSVVPGPHYFQAKRINAKLVTYGEYLLRATSIHVQLLNGTGTSWVPVSYTEAAITALGGSGCGTTWNICLGLFKLLSPSFTQAILVHNQDPNGAVCISLLTTTSPNEVNADTGLVSAAYNDAPMMAAAAFVLCLEAGDARLLVF